MQEQRGVIGEDSAREPVLRDEVRVFPGLGQRVETAGDLDEVPLSDGLGELSPRNAGLRRLRGGHVAVAAFCHFNKNHRVPSSRACVL